MEGRGAHRWQGRSQMEGLGDKVSGQLRPAHGLKDFGFFLSVVGSHWRE